MALAKDTEGVFKCAASVAPVTDWTYYGESFIDHLFINRFGVTRATGAKRDPFHNI